MDIKEKTMSNKKYFITSDIHSFFDIFHKALLDAGFEENNPDHILIVCGDIFDRGEQPLEVYHYLRNLPKEKRILIRGNHEFLLREMVNRGFSLSHDVSNGTKETLYLLNQFSEKEFNILRWEMVKKAPSCGTPEYKKWQEEYDEIITKKEEALYTTDIIKEILGWIFSDEWVNFYELDKYIFVHSFIPVTEKYNFKTNTETLIVSANWRESSLSNWEDATWGCPWKSIKKTEKSRTLKGKVIVCGHWHASDMWNNLDFARDYEHHMDLYEMNPIYKSDFCPRLIALDACTAATHGVNILTIDESMVIECHNHTHFDLEEYKNK